MQQDSNSKSFIIELLRPLERCIKKALKIIARVSLPLVKIHIQITPV